MSTPTPSHDPAADRRVISSDVLIIGGGVQGLWLLNDLRKRGYGALLLERDELGGGQTCHSHVYIHQGHLYREELTNLADRLRQVDAMWKEWSGAHSVERGFLPSIFGFESQFESDSKLALWQQLGLKYKATAIPRPLLNGKITKAFETPEICLTGDSLVAELRRPVDAQISLIEKVEDILVQSAGGDNDAWHVMSLSVVMGGERVIFLPGALVLAAGAENQALLELASHGSPALAERVKGAQQIRKAHMLVVKGSRSELEPLTGIFSDLGGLFIVSRCQNGEVVWLVSDSRSPKMSGDEDWSRYDAQWWLPLVMSGLTRLAPDVFELKVRPGLQWGVYDGPKAEGREETTMPHGERIESFGIGNLWALWPTKLTLAPVASSKVGGDIRNRIGPPSGNEPSAGWRDRRRPAPVARERWQTISLTGWREFSERFQLQNV